MKYKCVGSGSKGNMHILTSSSGQSLVIDLGFTYKTLKQALNFQILNVSCLVSHVHGDHFKGARDTMNAGINVYSLQETFRIAMAETNRRAKFILPDEPFWVGEYYVNAFEVSHNVPCLGFTIFHPEMGGLVYITDTGYMDLEFEGINHYLIEANYCDSILLNRVYDSKLNAFLGQRILDDHLSIQECQKILANQDMSIVQNIILGHLSDGNSHAVEFKSKIERQCGRPTHIADAGLELNLTLF